MSNTRHIVQRLKSVFILDYKEYFSQVSFVLEQTTSSRHIQFVIYIRKTKLKRWMNLSIS